jgi:competence protein ComEA
MKIFVVLVMFFISVFAAVDINHASAKELATLKGIGMKKANRIIAYRKKHGCFQDLKAFKKVKGVKKKTIKKNRENIVIGECKKGE